MCESSKLLPRALGDSLQVSDELGVDRIVSGTERVQRGLARREQDAEHRCVLFVSDSDPAFIPPGQRYETGNVCRFRYRSPQRSRYPVGGEVLGCGVRPPTWWWLAVLRSPGYHCNLVDAANDHVLADVGLLVHDRACNTRASADIAVMEKDGVSNLGPFLDDNPGADYRTRDGSADVRPPSDEAAVYSRRPFDPRGRPLQAHGQNRPSGIVERQRRLVGKQLHVRLPVAVDRPDVAPVSVELERPRHALGDQPREELVPEVADAGAVSLLLGELVESSQQTARLVCRRTKANTIRSCLTPASNGSRSQRRITRS